MDLIRARRGLQSGPLVLSDYHEKVNKDSPCGRDGDAVHDGNFGGLVPFF
jgi:hypothetical protein